MSAYKLDKNGHTAIEKEWITKEEYLVRQKKADEEYRAKELEIYGPEKVAEFNKFSDEVIAWLTEHDNK